MFKAFIFDRDGTLNRTTQILRAGQKEGDATDGYVLSPAELELFPEVKPALALLKERGIKSFVFTQQNCIGKGLLKEETARQIHAHLNTHLSPDATIEEFYLATHKDDPRAKPSPLMIRQIMEKYSYKEEDIIVLGDSRRDYESAKAAGVAFVWIKDDLNRVSMEDMLATGCPVFDNVLEAVTNILKNQEHS